MKHLSCQFKSNNNALVTGKLFCDWLLCLERKMVCHNYTSAQLWWPQSVLFLQVNTTCYIQPLDQDII
jgi:hypothetical protein